MIYFIIVFNFSKKKLKKKKTGIDFVRNFSMNTELNNISYHKCFDDDTNCEPKSWFSFLFFFARK